MSIGSQNELAVKRICLILILEVCVGACRRETDAIGVACAKFGSLCSSPRRDVENCIELARQDDATEKNHVVPCFENANTCENAQSCLAKMIYRRVGSSGGAGR